MNIAFSIETLTSGCEVDETWAATFEQRWVCKDCRKLDRRCRGNGYDVVLSTRPRYGAMDWAVGPVGTYSLIHRSFAELLTAGVTHDLVFGRVFLGDGVELKDYATYLGQKPIPIRGTSGSYRRQCKDCGSFIYSAGYSWYVARHALRALELYELDAGRLLVVDEARLKRIDRKRWKGIRIQKLPLVDEPQDGIAEFPDNWYYRGVPS